MRTKNFTTAIALSALASLPGVLNASASVVDAFSVSPNPVKPGDPASQDLQLTLTADPGDYNPQIIGGSVTFNSGFGPSSTINIPTSNATFADIIASFTYPAVGNYTPSFSAVVDYVEEYTAYGVVGYDYTVTGYSYVLIGYACGFSTCYRYSEIPEFGYVPEYGFYVADTGTQQEFLTGTDSLTVSPLPTTLPLFATGLGALGLFGWHRSWKALFAAIEDRNRR
jgi:hypothetical protein